MSFGAVPPEVLEHIAFFVATDPLLGPPVFLPTFISLSRRTYDTLAFDKNPLLYSRICAAKFDLVAPTRRLGKELMTAPALANELKKRVLTLKRLRSLALTHTVGLNFEEERIINETLWTMFLMVLEDDGRNISQLRHAQAADWLIAYWFDEAGTSGAVHLLQIDEWPASGLGAPVNSISSHRCSPHLTLAMWLLWFFLDPVSIVAKPELFRKAERMLKLIALNAPVYPLTQTPWTSFDAGPSHIHFGTETTRSDQPIDPYQRVASLVRSKAQSSPVMHFNTELKGITPPPAAAAAILSYLALTARARRDAHESSIFGADSYDGLHIFDAFVNRYAYGLDDNSYIAFQGMPETRRIRPSISSRWDCEWERCMDLKDSSHQRARAFNPGSIDGAWEGSFTYTEFHSFAALLAGAKPSKLRDCSLAEHNQTWRLREYHLLTSDEANAEMVTVNGPPLPAGDPLLAHVPPNIPISEENDGLSFTLPSTLGTGSSTSASKYLRYIPVHHLDESSEARDVYRSRVLDVLLTGEGHSGWGEFRLVGRVRPCDGFISILKEYNGGDRGRWLYRGFVIGGGEPASQGRPAGQDGYIAGRWRDTLTPAETHGYEGAFALTRRQ